MNKFFILIVQKSSHFDLFFIDSETKEIINSIRIRQDSARSWEAMVNRVDFDISNESFIFSTGFDLYVFQLSNLKKTFYYPPFKLDKIGNEPIPCIDLSYLSNTEITKNGFDYFPLEQVNKAYPFDPLYIECVQYEEIQRQVQLDIVGIECSKSGNILISYSDNTACLFDSKFQFVKRIKSVDKGWPMSSGFIDEFNLIYFPCGNSIRFFDLNGEYLFDLFNNYEIILAHGYYSFSKDFIRRNHFVTNNLQVIGFEQLDPVYNRPDIVLDSIGKYFGGADKELVTNYRESWEKRIDRLGLDKEKLGKGDIAVPDAEIVEADKIAYENKDGKLVINVKANDSKYTLRRFNVYVNEVPLYGSAGISITHLNAKSWTTTDTIPLSIGENKIQVSVMNELGLENFKYPTYVNYTPENNKEIFAKTHYIGIGVNEFKEAGHNLNYCVKDVRDLAKAFSAENTKIDTLLFTDEQVTRENILALKEYLKKTSVNDKVIISCSSHGLLDDSLNFYLAMHDVDFNKPQARGLKYEELESLLDGIPARQKLLLLDACNSGENDKTEVLKKELKQNEKSMDSTQILASRGVIIKLEEENKSNFKKMSELFVNVRNNTGSVIISAAGGQESALEAIQVDGKTIENGAFTYSILECLKQNEGKELKVNTLKKYAEKRVEEITNGKQKPTSRQETMEVDWRVR